MRLLPIIGLVILLNAALAIGIGWNPFGGGDGSGPDRLALIQLLRSGEFATLEDRLQDYQKRYESGGVPESVPVRAFDAFAYGDPDLQRQLDLWVEQYPQSYAAALARGIYHHHVGWLSRGRRSIRETSAARLAAMQQHHRIAYAEFGRALTLNRRLPLAYANLMKLLTANGNPAGARAATKAGLTVAPSSWNIIAAYLWSLEPRWGGSYAAIREFIDAIQASLPADADLGYLALYDDYARASDLIGVRCTGEAIAILNRILREVGDDPTILYTRGDAYYCAKDYAAALADYQRVDELVPDDPETLFSMGATYMKLDKEEAGLAAWDRAIALDPYNPKYLRARGLRLSYIGRHTEAVEDYRKAAVYAGGDPEFHFERSQVYVEMYGPSRGDEVIAALREAITLAPRNEKYWNQYRYYLTLYGEGCEGPQVIQEFLAACERYHACESDDARKWQARAAFIKERYRCPG